MYLQQHCEYNREAQQKVAPHDGVNLAVGGQHTFQFGGFFFKGGDPVIG